MTKHLSLTITLLYATILAAHCSNGASNNCPGGVMCPCDEPADCHPGFTCFSGICAKSVTDTSSDIDNDTATDTNSDTASSTESDANVDSESDTGPESDTGQDSDTATLDPGNITKIFVLAGQSNMQGQGQVDPANTPGTLAYMVEHNSKDSLYSRLIKKNGSWKERGDVWVEYPREEQPVSAKLNVGQGANGSLIGPEYGFGFEVGTALQSEVVIIKAAWGGKSLAVDFRPPSSGGSTGLYYQELLNVVDEAIERLLTSGQIIPGAYEISGFGWHQGWNDAENQDLVDEYQDNLSNLIRDLRQQWGKPKLPVVIATSGQGGTNPPDAWFERVVNGIRPAQMAVAADAEFSQTVQAIDTLMFWREPNVSPADEGHHWNRNAESYYLIGVSMGQAMVGLLEAAQNP